MGRLTKRHGKHAVQIGAETRRNDIGWLKLADYEDMEEQGKLIEQKHGAWEIHDEYYFCTNCYSEWKETFAYCPCCGAKMKGDKNGLD